MASPAFKSTLSVGQRLPGKHWQYKLTQRLPSGWSSNNLFKAEILDDTTGLAPKWAAIKSAPASAQTSLIIERNEYAKPNISSCPSIRPLFDVIDFVNDETVSGVRDKGVSDPPPYLAFAWMDGDLCETVLKNGKKDLALFEAITTGVLQGLVPFEENHRVHTDIKGDNIMIECLDSGVYRVSLGDLGCATDDGVAKDLRGACGSAAPEVLEGKGYSHCSDVWALGMTLLKIFREDGFKYDLPEGTWYPEADAIATLMCLYPNWVPEPVEGGTLMGVSVQDLFAQARKMKPHLPLAPLEQLLEDMDAHKHLKDMLRLLLSLDGKKRSSATAILESSEYLALRNAICLLNRV